MTNQRLINAPTKNPVEELRSREDSNVVMVEPYQDEIIPGKGPAVVLIVTD